MSPTPAAESLELAAAALERQDWTRGVSLLVALLDRIDGQQAWIVEATARGLLAQALHEMGPPEDGFAQAKAALAAAESTDERSLIHRCMALVETFHVLNRDRL